MKVLILGKNGMLGSYFLKFLSGREDFELFAFSRNELDLKDHKAIGERFKALSPDFVINCAAYTNVAEAEGEGRDLCFKVNSDALKPLAEYSKKEGAHLIHFSTDYVFDGTKKEGYDEDDVPGNTLNVYGESKLLGEKNIMDFTDRYYIARTAWLYGPNGKNFVDTMLKLAKDRDNLKVVNDQYGSPTYIHDLVDSVFMNFLSPRLTFLERNHGSNIELKNNYGAEIYEPGIFHITNDGHATWYDLARKTFEIKGVEIDLEPCSSDEYPSPAKRPEYSILNNNKLPKLRSWEDALKAYLSLS